MYIDSLVKGYTDSFFKELMQVLECVKEVEPQTQHNSLKKGISFLTHGSPKWLQWGNKKPISYVFLSSSQEEILSAQHH